MSARPRRSWSVSGRLVITLVAGLVVAGPRTSASPATGQTLVLAQATEPAVRVVPPTPPTPPVPPPEDPAPADPSAAVIDLTNQRRAAAGRSPLVRNAALTAAAMQHSIDQASRRRMSHTGSDGSTVGQRIERNGGSFRTWGENVAAGYPSATRVVDAWMNSAGHRAAMMNASFTQIGVGFADAADGTRFWTMVLAG